MSKLTDIETKIANLLAKAESTDSPHEAEALSEAAMKLMVKHGIEAATVDAARGKGETREGIIEQRITWLGSHAIEWLEFTWALSFAIEEIQVLGINTRDYGDTGKEMSIAIVIGHESDVRMFMSLQASLQLQCIGAQKVWWKGYEYKKFMNNSQKWRERAMFTKTFGNAAANKIRSSRREVIVEAGESTAMVLADRGNAVKAWVATNHTTKDAKNRKSTGSAFAAAAGREAGSKANTGDNQISSVRAIGV